MPRLRRLNPFAHTVGAVSVNGPEYAASAASQAQLDVASSSLVAPNSMLQPLGGEVFIDNIPVQAGNPGRYWSTSNPPSQRSVPQVAPGQSQMVSDNSLKGRQIEYISDKELAELRIKIVELYLEKVENDDTDAQRSEKLQAIENYVLGL